LTCIGYLRDQIEKLQKLQAEKRCLQLTKQILEFLRRTRWCMFHRICKHFRQDSYTCTVENGGRYCGKWREYRWNISEEAVQLYKKGG
jgi:hypothetical protein